MPAWDVATLIGLGVPLYLVTMASQNLPGFAVLRASGYQPPTQPVLAVTGAASLGTAFLGAHTSNLAAISAALCTGPDAHPDPAKRWMAGPFYALWWGLIALFGASLVGLFGALPPALLATVAGTALLGSMAGAMGAALAAEKDRFAAAGTLAVTASGVTLMGVGSAFWGLSSACWCWPWSACCAAHRGGASGAAVCTSIAAPPALLSWLGSRPSANATNGCRSTTSTCRFGWPSFRPISHRRSVVAPHGSKAWPADVSADGEVRTQTAAEPVICLSLAAAVARLAAVESGRGDLQCAW